MTIRLQSLTMTAEQKVRQKGCFGSPLEVKNKSKNTLLSF
jgi:hypothetical protein